MDGEAQATKASLVPILRKPIGLGPDHGCRRLRSSRVPCGLGYSIPVVTAGVHRGPVGFGGAGTQHGPAMLHCWYGGGKRPCPLGVAAQTSLAYVGAWGGFIAESPMGMTKE